MNTTLAQLTLFILVFLMNSNLSFSQQRLYLRSIENPALTKQITTRKYYDIVTTDSSFNGYRVTSFNDSSIYLTNRKGQNLTLGNEAVQNMIKSKTYNVFDVIATLGIIMLTITPIEYAVNGKEEGNGTLEAAGWLLGISVPFILLREPIRKRKLSKQWVLKTAT